MKFENEARGAVLVEEAVKTAEIEWQKLDRDAVRSSVAVRLGLPKGIGGHDRAVDGPDDFLLQPGKGFMVGNPGKGLLQQARFT